MSDRLSKLVTNFENYICLPWQKVMSAAERSIYVIYNKDDELKIRARIGEFEHIATKYNHPWQLLDITDSFAQWMAKQEYKDGYFEEPEYLTTNYVFFKEDLIEELLQKITDHHNENAIIALVGTGTLFGITSVSGLVKELADKLEGRLIVFFPGEKNENEYRLLDAKDGWDYQATSITASE